MSAELEMRWEWPANRNIEKRIAVKIEKIKDASQGFLGIKGSPSLAAALPDPVVVTGTIVTGDPLLKGKIVRLTLPKLELETIEVGHLAMLGLVAPYTCVCIKRVEENTDLEKVNCN